MNDLIQSDLLWRIERILESPSDRFDDLVRAAGLDPKKDLRFGDWQNLDFSDSDLRAFDFTGCNLSGANFNNALIEGAKLTRANFELASLEKAADYVAFRRSRRQIKPQSTKHQKNTEIEISGAVKWFDVGKGYGFIVPDNGLPDVLLHKSCLLRDGYQTAYEGARVTAEVVRGPKGLQCLRILSMDEFSVVNRVPPAPIKLREAVTPTSSFELARVKWFNRLRGFGFLTRGVGTPDIFVHMETLRQCGFTALKPDQYVLVCYGLGSKGLMAAAVRSELHAKQALIH